MPNDHEWAGKPIVLKAFLWQHVETHVRHAFEEKHIRNGNEEKLTELRAT